jgi:predicted MFS family arabinose efflux permease
LITNTFIVIGYVLFSFFTPDPHHPLAIISISIASFGIYGLMTLGYVVVNKNCGHKARGSVMGLNCLFGAIAILIIAKAGGLAFDHIDKNAPFIASAALSVVLILITLIPSFRKKINES